MSAHSNIATDAEKAAPTASAERAAAVDVSNHRAGSSRAGAPVVWSWTGETVHLRELRDTDVPSLVEWLNESDVASTQSTGPIHPKPMVEAATLFTQFSANQGTNLGLSIVRRTDEELIGHVMLYGIESKDRCGNVSIMVGPAYQGHGYGHDAMSLLVRYAFTELGLHRVELSVNAFNGAGLALYRKLAFVEEGRRRGAIFRAGAWHDHVFMGLLASEWLESSHHRE